MIIIYKLKKQMTIYTKETTKETTQEINDLVIHIPKGMDAPPDSIVALYPKVLSNHLSHLS